MICHSQFVIGNLQLIYIGIHLTCSQSQRMLHSTANLNDMNIIEKLYAPSNMQRKQRTKYSKNTFTTALSKMNLNLTLPWPIDGIKNRVPKLPTSVIPPTEDFSFITQRQCKILTTCDLCDGHCLNRVYPRYEQLKFY